MTDTIKINNLIENMKELEVEEQPEEPQQPVVKEKRKTRCIILYFTTSERSKWASFFAFICPFALYFIDF